MSVTSTAQHSELRGVIVAGGRATRMGEASARVPKALLEVEGRSVLARQLDQFRRAGVGRVTVLAGHLGERLVEAAAELSDAALEVEVLVEDEALGSGGCLRLLGEPREALIVVFGDVLFDLDLGELVAEHRRTGAWISAAVHPNEHPHDSDLVEIDGHGRIVALHRKPHPPEARLANLVTAALFVVEPGFVAEIPARVTGAKLDFVHDLLGAALDRGRHVQAWRTCAYLKDMGTPRRWAEAEADYAAGVPARRRAPRPTAFLDRDGTINRHVGHVCRPEQIELLPGAARAIARLNRANVQVVLVTNQPVVARGECDEAGLAEIHAELERLLGRAGAYLDRIYHCPHHPDAGYANERPELKIRCACRKPGIGMITRARAELLVDDPRSVLIGDSERDLGAATAAGLRPILVGSEAQALAAAQGVAWFEDLDAACVALLRELGVASNTKEERAC